MSEPEEDVTQLLLAWTEGDPQALDRLMPLVYDELYLLARHYLGRERKDHTLQPTALVNEAYLRLVGNVRPQWKGRVQFMAVASQLMRRVLVDHARVTMAAKRGGGVPTVSLDHEQTRALEVSRASQAVTDLLELNEALDELARFDARKCRIIELRYFGGLSLEETAEALEVSVPTVVNDTRIARAWLRNFLDPEPRGNCGSRD